MARDIDDQNGDTRVSLEGGARTSAANLAAAHLFEHGASAICVYDAQDRIQCWNDQYLDFFPEVRASVRVGLPFEDTVRPFLRLQHPGMSPADMETNIASALLRHRTEAGPLQYQRADSGRWLELRMFVQPDGGRVKVWSDVSGTKAQGTDSDQLLRLMAVANVGLIVHDAQGRLKFVNSRFFSEHFLRIITAMPAILTRDLAGLYWSKFSEIFAGDAHYGEMRSDDATGALRQPVTLRARTGRYYRIEEQPLEGGIASIWTDVTTLIEGREALNLANAELTELNARLRDAAETDPLTGLPNRRRFDSALQEAHRALDAGRSGGASTVAILDLDHFKAVNDSGGHEAGDRVLIEAVRRLRGALLPNELMARLGGEEFGVLFGGVDLATALDRAETLRACLEAAPFVVDGRALVVTGSIGLAPLERDLVISASVRNADQALFQAKERGRNQVAGSATRVGEAEQTARAELWAPAPRA